MKITFNEVVETLAPAIADKLNLRVVMNCKNDETMLIDFSASGDPFSGGVVCSWCLQRDRFTKIGWCGVDEVDAGVFYSYMDVFSFVLGHATVYGTELFVESF